MKGRFEGSPGPGGGQAPLAPLPEDQVLTPEQAEAVVEERIEQFGHGVLPDLTVRPQSDGSWLVRWDTFERTVWPMRPSHWRAWLEEHVGPLSPEQLQTTES